MRPVSRREPAVRVMSISSILRSKARLCRIASWLALSLALDSAGAAVSVGLSTVRARLLADESIAEWWRSDGDSFGGAVAAGDFNGDGAADLAIGIPRHDGLHGATPGSGIVVVSYGVVGRGLQTSGATTVLRLASPQELDTFGAALTAGDFNGDHYDDLAIGVPGYGSTGTGLVALHFGGTGGIEEIAADWLLDPAIEPSEGFGSVLASGDFNGDFYDDLAVGMPYQDRIVGGQAVSGGVVHVFHGPDPASDSGFEVSQLDAQIPDAFESGDYFGFALAVGNFNGDERCGEFGCAALDDLAIGVPGEDFGAGKVLVLFGSEWSLLFGSAHWYGESQLGGTATDHANFGHTLAAGNFNGGAAEDLLVAAPYKPLSGAAWAGQVTALYGQTFFDGSWFDVDATRWLSQTAFYGVGANGPSDRFGWSLAVGDFDGDGFDDAAVGHPGEAALPGGNLRGGLSVLTGSAVNPPGPGRYFRYFGAGFAGVPISSADFDEFGEVLATGDFDGDGHSDLVVGLPKRDVAGTGEDVGAAVLLYGSLFADGVEWDGSLLFWSDWVP